MRKVSLLLIAILGSVAGAALAAASKDVSPHPLGERSVFSNRAIAERIKPVGTVCVEGEECGSGAVADTAAAAPRSGSEVYNAACMACHASGAAGAPVTGNASQWAPRIAKGMSSLVKSAINGLNAMPPKGGCFNCSDDEVKAAVEYIVGESR